LLKYNRNYYFVISTNDGSPAITVGYPLTLDFTVSRNTMGGIQEADFTIFNLGENTRKLINKNFNDFLNSPTVDGDPITRTIDFYAGYGPTSNLPLVFHGLIFICNSVREEGSTDWQTNITCQDPGFPVTTQTALTATPSQQGLPSVRNLIGQLNGVIKGGVYGHAFDSIPNYNRTIAYKGDYLGILNQICGGNQSGGNFHFENGVINVLLENEAFDNDGFPTINSDSGLLGSPYVEQTWIFANMLFEPRVKMGQVVDLEATGISGLQGINGQKKVMAYTHAGTISGSVGGKCHTQIQLYANLNSQGIEIVGGQI